jgi:hypothetical protein
MSLTFFDGYDHYNWPTEHEIAWFSDRQDIPLILTFRVPVGEWQQIFIDWEGTTLLVQLNEGGHLHMYETQIPGLFRSQGMLPACFVRLEEGVDTANVLEVPGAFRIRLVPRETETTVQAHHSSSAQEQLCQSLDDCAPETQTHDQRHWGPSEFDLSLLPRQTHASPLIPHLALEVLLAASLDTKSYELSSLTSSVPVLDPALKDICF